MIITITCPRCLGTGTVKKQGETLVCRICDGTGTVDTLEPIRGVR